MLVLEYQSFIMNHHNLVFKKKKIRNSKAYNHPDILKSFTWKFILKNYTYFNHSPKIIYAYIYIVFVKIFKLNIWNSNEIYNKAVFHFHLWLIFFNKNNTFIYKYAYTRIGTIKMVLQDDSKPSIIKSMIICFSYHLWWQSSSYFYISYS